MESAFRQIGGVHHIPGRDICRPKYFMLHSESKSKNQRQALQAAPVDFSGQNMICGMLNNVLQLHFSPQENKTHDLDSHCWSTMYQEQTEKNKNLIGGIHAICGEAFLWRGR